MHNGIKEPLLHLFSQFALPTNSSDVQLLSASHPTPCRTVHFRLRGPWLMPLKLVTEFSCGAV